MSKDIVERLRACMSDSLEWEAADEIERLRAFPSADALESARRILGAVAEMKGKSLAVAFRDEQTAQYVSLIIENAAKVSRALLGEEQ